MPGNDGASTAIFISYRRADSAPYAGRLYDRLADVFGADNLFMDVDSIGLGVDFATAIRNAVSSCDVLLAIIGPEWLAGSTEGRRLDHPDDYVRLEIETALDRNVRVVPVLVDGAQLPARADLPESLQPLVNRQTLRLSHDQFRTETQRLIDDIKKGATGARAERGAANAVGVTSGAPRTGLSKAVWAAIIGVAAVIVVGVAILLLHSGSSSPPPAPGPVTSDVPTPPPTPPPSRPPAAPLDPEATIRALDAVGVDYTLPKEQLDEYLSNPDYTSYPAVATKLLDLLGGRGLRQPVPIDSIVFYYENSPGHPSARRPGDVDLAVLKTAVVDSFNDQYNTHNTDFDSVLRLPG